VPEPRPVYLTRPPKPVSAMTEGELQEYAHEVWTTFMRAEELLDDGSDDTDTDLE
jgi:hypothetical protein